MGLCDPGNERESFICEQEYIDPSSSHMIFPSYFDASNPDENWASSVTRLLARWELLDTEKRSLIVPVNVPGLARNSDLVDVERYRGTGI